MLADCISEEQLVKWLQRNSVLPTDKAIKVAYEVITEIEPYALSHLKRRLLSVKEKDIN